VIELRPVPFLRRFYTLFTGFFAVLALGSLSAALIDRNGAPSPAAAIVFGVFWTLCFVLCAFGVLTSTRRWRIDQHSIRRLGFLARELSWTEILRVEVRQDPRDYMMTFHYRQGERLSVDLGSLGADGRAFVEAVTRHLPPEVRGERALSTEIPGVGAGLLRTLGGVLIALVLSALAYRLLLPMMQDLL
jgi:hypothetical protein